MAARRVDHRVIKAEWTPDDFSHRLLPRVLVQPFVEPEAETVTQVVL
jgi:hypothetical protein